MYSKNDTIAAIATPIGEGGISVIRVSGKEALNIVDKGFNGRIQLAKAKSHTAHFGIFKDSKSEIIDEVITTIFVEPNSYTGENVVEISCHGGVYVTNKILSELIANGCRFAEPGEFTFRAFLNGRIDLSQAEAVSDLISARSEYANKVSIQTLQGSLSDRIKKIKNLLTHYCGLIELELDFSEEDIAFTSQEKLKAQINEIDNSISELISTYSAGKIIREGIKVVLVGPPNVGKSSILNVLLGHDRAIVTDIPGTTRDKIEENLILDGILLKLVDTAGLRESTDIVEIEGFKKTYQEISSADVILFIVDQTVEFQKLSETLIDILKDNRSIIVRNKIDLHYGYTDLSKYQDIAIQINISALTGENIELLKTEIKRMILTKNNIDLTQSHFLINERQKTCLENARKSISLAKESIRLQRTNEFIAVDLRKAANSLAEIIGEITTEDILKDIFSNFCIGK
ncbi:MAG: tRNA uridine-5-carboxymethylaminomethyl(34) synthesis GTPase MnmE [Ignavibacteriales bacterium]|nr:tRNA uridine-5-carboxymethylaminomethyl(34) synthesis GTPase MnmE [Ignavibacteriales bacterium]